MRGYGSMVDVAGDPVKPAEVLASHSEDASAGFLYATPVPPNYNKDWLRKWLRLEPHIILGGDDPYLKRWYVIPRNQRFNIYLHKFCKSDEDRALHDHPWNFWSFILKGRYIEHTPEGPLVRDRFSLAYRPAEHSHRVELEQEEYNLNPNLYREVPTWTLFMTSKKRREWGFHCPKGWVHWEKFTSGPKGERSIGCGEFE